MKTLTQMLCLVLISAATAVGQQQKSIHYFPQLIGFLDAQKTVQIYALAKVDQEHRATLRTMPHEETIVTRTMVNGTVHIEPIAVINDVHFVRMAAITDKASGARTLYFSAMHKSGNAHHFKYSPNTRRFETLPEGKIHPFPLPFENVPPRDGGDR